MAFQEFTGKLDEPAGAGFVPFTGQLDEPLKKPIQSEPILSPEDLMMGSIGAPNTEPPPQPRKPVADQRAQRQVPALPDTRGTISRIGDFLRPQYQSVLETPVSSEQQQLNIDRRLTYGAGPISQETESAAAAASLGVEKTKNQTVKKVANVMAERDQPLLSDLISRAKDPAVIRAAREAKAEEFRSAGEWAADTLSNVSQGTVGLVQLPLNIFAPSGELAQTLSNTQKELQAQESDVLKAQRAQLLERVQNEDGFFGKYFATVKSLITNPALSISEAAKQVPNFLSIMGVAKLGGALTGAAINTASRFSPTIALSEAISANALRTGAQAAGTKAGGLTAAGLMAGGDAAGNTYETLTDPKKTPLSVWKTNPDFQQLVAQGRTPKQAIEEIATAKARFAAAITFPLGLLGFMGAEAAILARLGSRAALQAVTPKGAAKIFGKEIVGEQIEEGGTQAGSNVASQTVNPQQSLTEGVPEAMATAAVTAAPFAGAAVARQALQSQQTQADPLAEAEARRRLDVQSYDPNLVDPTSTRRPVSRAVPSRDPVLDETQINAGIDPLGRIDPSFNPVAAVPPVVEAVPGMMTDEDLAQPENVSVTPVTVTEPEVTPFTAPAGFAYTLTESPAYKGIQPMAADDVDSELEFFQDLALRNSLTPQVIAQSEIGKRLDTGQINLINAAIQTNSLAAVQALQTLREAIKPLLAPAAAPEVAPAAPVLTETPTKDKWLKAINDQNRLQPEGGVQLTVTPEGKLNFMGDPSVTKQGRALEATLNEAIKAGATVEEIAASINRAKQPAPPVTPVTPVKPTVAAASLPETPTVPPAQTPKLFEPAPSEHQAQDMPVVAVPVKDLKLSEDVPQFKSGASAKGVVEPLRGKFTTEGVAPIAVWRRLDGSMEVISGRHRLDLAQRSGTEFINAQVYEEAQGFDANDASMRDAELNIRDEQGKVKDYVNYFKTSGTDKEAADAKGLLGRVKGKWGFTIANQGSDALISAINSDQVGDEAAYYITINAPNNERLQNVGLQAIMDGKSMNTAVNTMQAVKAIAVEQDTTTDMFGLHDDSLIKEAQEMAKIAAKMQQSINSRLSAITGAAKNPAMAKAEGIDIRDPDAIKRRIEELRAQKAALENWSTSPELVAEIRAARGVAAPVLELRGETEAEIRAREATQDADRQAQEAKDRADRERDFFQLQPQVAEREEAPTMDMFAGEAAPSAEYQAASELANRPTVVKEAPVLSEKELSGMQNELVKLQQQKSVMIDDTSLVDNEIEDIEDALREAGIDPREFAIEANEAQGEDIVNDEQAPDNLPSNQRLLLMPCSDMKGPAKATAMELYKGVFFQTYKSNVQPGAFPLVVILSAKHGFINTNQEIAPYDEVMSTARADTMLANLPKYIANIKIPSGITDVMIVGGKEYQRVMRAAVAELQSFGLISPEASINATLGGIGVQRQQLGEYLRAMQPTVPVITQEPFTIDVEARVIDENVKRLPAPDVQKLEKHYGVKRGTDDFVQMVKDDIVRFANEGAQAVAKAVREIIRKLHAGVLSAAMIFNPTNISSPEFLFHPSYTYREEKQVLAEVPEEVIPRMSPSARQAYKVLYPSIQDRLIKSDKLMVIADKPSARVFVFKPDGSLLLDKKVLYGSAIGDFYKGNNDLPQNRITPAGLFTLGLRDATRSAGEARTAGEYDFKKVFVLDKAIGGEYSVTLMHSVWLNDSDVKAREKALQTPEAADSRYSFGCINVDKPTYSFLINNHLQQMDGASLFVVPDDPANLTAMLAGKEKVGDELNRTTFKTPTVEIKKTGQLPSAKARAATELAAGERRKKPSDFLFNVEEPNKRQINTPKFKRWFSNSKVVNEDGSPKVMYHGTNKSFNEFVIAEKANRTGMPDGFYFTSDPEDASRYAQGEGANVLPVYLSIKNPFNLGGKNKISKEMVMQFRDELRADNPTLPFSWIQEKVEIFQEKTAAGRFPFPSISFPTAAMQRVFEAGGYDGLIDGSKVFVAFNSNQVKSAIGNDGTFGESGNILENVTQEPSLAEQEGDLIFGRDKLRKEQIKEYASMRAALARVPKQVAAGKVDLSMQAAVTRLVQQARDLNAMIKVTKPRLDSAEQFLAKAAIEFDKGNISEDVFNVIKTAYDKMPELLGGLLLSVKAPTGKAGGRAAGQFLPFTRVVRLYKGTSGVTDPATIEHELAHSLEQMMTPEQRAVVAQSWLKGLQAAIKKNPDEKHQKYFHAVMDFIDRPTEENFRKAQDLLPSYDMYQFINPSEFWAVNAENLMAAELGNAWGKFKRAIARLWEGLKNVLGFDNRYVVQKMFKDVMNGSKERISKEMLVDLVGSAGVQFNAFENIEDDKKLLEKYNRPNTPQLDQSPLKTQVVNAGKLSKDFFTYAVSGPREALGSAANYVDRSILYARITNVWFGSGLNAADFSRYNGDLVTSQGLATASVALDNAIRGGQIATEVIFQGGIKFDPKSRNFVAVKRDKGMRGVYEAEAALKKRLGNQLGTDIIQGYLEAKRSRSIQNEYFDREVEYEFFKSNYDDLRATNAPEEDIMAARDAMAEAKEDLQAIEVVYKKIRMSDEEIDDFIARDAVHPELRKIMTNWSAINQNMLAFWKQVGLLSEKRYENLSNIKDYVPWQRIMNDETDIHSPVQASNRKMTNIGLEKLFKKGKPTVITDFVAKDGQQDFKIQPAAEVEVEINGSPVDPDKFTMTADGQVKLDVPVTADDLVVFKASREIENIIDNMTRNVMRMTMNGLRQAAAQRIVKEYATRIKNGKIMVFPKADKARGRFDFIVNGQRVIVEIQDPLIAESIFGMESLDIAMLAPLAAMANFTRRTITLSGVFQIKQVFKDAPTAALVTGVKHPLLLIGGVYKGFVTSLLNTDPTVKILKAAGIGGFQSLARTPEAEIKRRLGIMNRNVFDFVIKGLDHIGDASDMAQRVAVYKRVLAETGNETQALYQAANVINFLHHGSGQAAQAIVKIVPFAGAYANSIDVLVQALAGGGLKGRSRKNAWLRLASTATLLVGITLLYCMLVGDDDDYNQMDDQTKLRNFMIPGTKILLPMNTSAAYFYKAVPEMIYNKVVKEGTKNAVDGRRRRTALKEAAIDMLLGPTPVPSGIKPLVEIGLNKDFFTGRPVVPESLAKLDAAERYTAATSEAGKLLSSLTGTKEKRLLDPLEADHLIRGIFGTAGAMAQWFTNSIAVSSGERVAPTDKEQPITGSFLRGDVGRRNEDLFYDFKSVVDNKYGTYSKMLEREDDKAADAYEEKHSDILDFYKDVNKIDSELKEINAEIRYYGESKDTGLTPDQRREEIKQLQIEKQEMLDDIIEMRKEAGL